LARRRGRAVALDQIYLERACELAARAVGSTSPNPPVGAVIVRDGATLGEGFHHRHGTPHAEVEALRAAGGDAVGATVYISLEPCAHPAKPARCADALIAARVVRVVAGALDPDPATRGRGVATLRAAGIVVDVVDDPAAGALVERFGIAVASTRPFVTLKIAASLDGYAAPRPGSFWLTDDAARDFVRDLRAAHDAVMAGAGTVATDDPLLTVRPPHARAVPYRRVVVCDRPPFPAGRRILDPVDGYGPTIVLVAGSTEPFGQLEGLAEVVAVGGDGSASVDMGAGLVALKQRGIASVLCEGGPRLAARLLAGGFVDRIEWLVAPITLAGPDAIAAIAPLATPESWAFDRVETLGPDVRISARRVAA
jgi:diaminohydroxyphosphoribosylaminopyrimidine deaminase/5-amino-6-(5-phosphoribosylamino)uracil reductase